DAGGLEPLESVRRSLRDEHGVAGLDDWIGPLEHDAAAPGAQEQRPRRMAVRHEDLTRSEPHPGDGQPRALGDELGQQGMATEVTLLAELVKLSVFHDLGDRSDVGPSNDRDGYHVLLLPPW